MKRILFMVLLILVIFTNHSPGGEKRKPKVVASIYPLASVVSEVGGNRVEVDCLIPPGISPHGYELKPSDMEKIANAHLLVLAGAGLEAWMIKAIKMGRARVFLLAQNLPLEEDNPHVWLDPMMVKKRIPSLVNALKEIDPEGGNYYTRRGQQLSQKLVELTRSIAQRLSSIKCKTFISQHNAWLYFARRFSLKCLGIVEDVPGKEPGPRRIQKLISLARKYHYTLLFSEFGENPRVMKVIARDSGAHLVRLDPLGDPKVPEKRSLLGLLEFNTEKIMEACLGIDKGR